MTKWKCLRVGEDITWDEAHKIITSDPYFSLSTLEKIEEFKNHPKGWDFGDGDPSPQHVVDSAIALHEFGVSLGLKTDAYPLTDGGIEIEFYYPNSDEAVGILTELDLTYRLRHEKGIGWEYDVLKEDEGISLDDAKDYVRSVVPLPPRKEGVVFKD
jgi:hypothetical protein